MMNGYGYDDLAELQVKLIQMRKEIEEEEHYEEFARVRRAAIAKKEREEKQRERQVTELLCEGYDTDQVSYILDIPSSVVARIEEHNKARLEFLATGELPKEPGVFTIFTGIPTPRKES